ncbi:hypothetical protein FC07_GL002696 [Loigolactobacillus bifermentans DSM 20003]|uniref:Uncharacterized protein n=1 Tax=Loigolactobacillus bifermentans DSM 20003 TaxID=1423726 RepID=A0A0R1H542_9LACO|nr:hypothetical protein FC07_GL002696 [Loigolactobacillus bifermentans DSM 20003]
MYVATTLFHWTFEFLMDATPNLFMKNYVMWLRQNNPDAIEERQEVFMDEVPFWN